MQINSKYDNIDEGETIMRTLGDSWVVIRKSGHRRFFVVLNQKSANFADINGKCTTLNYTLIAYSTKVTCTCMYIIYVVYL